MTRPTKISDVDLTDDQWSQTSLSIHNRRPGIRSTQILAPSAFFGLGCISHYCSRILFLLRHYIVFKIHGLQIVYLLKDFFLWSTITSNSQTYRGLFQFRLIICMSLPFIKLWLLCRHLSYCYIQVTVFNCHR